MRITIVTAVLNQKEMTQQFLDKLRETEGSNKFPLLIVDNGSTEPVRDWLKGLRDGDLVIRNGENEGVVKAYNQAWTVLKDTTDYIFYIHNDVLIHEQNWSDKIVRILENTQNVGMAGFYGAKAIGTPDIYRTPYFQQQLIRMYNVSGCLRMNPAIHGFRPPVLETEKVAVLDGFSMIVKTELLNKVGGLDRQYPPHHMYDNDLCLVSLDQGYDNYVISMDADHLGGRTDVGEDWTKPFGKTKQEIHTEAHPIFYEKWRAGKHNISLPVRVE